eukprot:CAMPEP_0197601766 /NCGR_PEP_ID=MMETSP1326-20131121/35918_1 /TAXON_ID=1155430 /ORGANISM="Genus nov. species nov., Strain RCC2288" /LENGTH=530 /DNA_ID=CAMNT_0043169025 /DNA_START=140 /DNA_END=1729 /DNA_ORIENTATION=+
MAPEGGEPPQFTRVMERSDHVAGAGVIEGGQLRPGIVLSGIAYPTNRRDLKGNILKRGKGGDVDLQQTMFNPKEQEGPRVLVLLGFTGKWMVFGFLMPGGGVKVLKLGGSQQGVVSSFGDFNQSHASLRSQLSSKSDSELVELYSDKPPVDPPHGRQENGCCSEAAYLLFRDRPGGMLLPPVLLYEASGAIDIQMRVLTATPEERREHMYDVLMIPHHEHLVHGTWSAQTGEAGLAHRSCLSLLQDLLAVDILQFPDSWLKLAQLEFKLKPNKKNAFLFQILLPETTPAFGPKCVTEVAHWLTQFDHSKHLRWCTRVSSMSDDDWHILRKECIDYCHLERRCNLSAKLGACELNQRRWHNGTLMQVFHTGGDVTEAVVGGRHGRGKTLFMIPRGERVSPEDTIVFELHFSFSNSALRLRVYASTDLGTGSHGFYRLAHFVALYILGRLYSRGKKLVTMRDMVRVLQGHKQKDLIMGQLIIAGMMPDETNVSASVSANPVMWCNTKSRKRGGPSSMLYEHMKDIDDIPLSK